jgi:hypothetical protein
VPRETLKDAIVRIVKAAGRELTVTDVIEFLAAEGCSVENAKSLSTMLSQLAGADTPATALGQRCTSGRAPGPRPRAGPRAAREGAPGLPVLERHAGNVAVTLTLHED